MSGTTSGASLSSLSATGAMDAQLTGKPKVTHWRQKHVSHTNFAMEHIHSEISQAAFGGTGIVHMERTADLIYTQYVKLSIPGLFPLPTHGHTDSYPNVLSGGAFGGGEGNYMPAEEIAAGLSNPLGGYYCHWVNAVGYKILKNVALTVGSVLIDEIDSDYMYMWRALGKPVSAARPGW